MSTIKVMVNGLPGNVTQMIASHIARDEALTLLPYSLTGPEIDIDRIAIEDTVIELIRPDRRDASIMTIKDTYDSFISVGFHPPFRCQSQCPLLLHPWFAVRHGNHWRRSSGPS